uniref:E-beta-farnesene synthase n=1 Tax=Tanacetum cinerariifolium TaxID=118510 RepID=A0A6L2MN08_TANCI|nr:hypothetical protein [Tanacetum cinerariifolium]
MADVNVHALTDQAPTMAPPIHTDDQILPHIRWVPIGKSKCYLDVEKSQSNPIYKIAFWDIVRYDKTAGCYKCQLEEQWFDLTKDTLRDALQINRALITIINLGLMGNTSGFESPRALVLQILWSRKHKFHPRPDSPLHLPNEELVLGYLKFSAKGTKREVFGMPIPCNLITANIQGKSYYQEYLTKVAKHQRYLAGETGSDPDSLAPNPTKNAKKPSQARKSKPGLVTKRRKPTSSLRSVDESVAKDIPEKEPKVDDEEADVQRALKESLKSMYDVPRGPLPPVVIREPESGKYQPLLETPKKKSPADRYIFQSDEESNEDVSGTDSGVQGKGQAGPNLDALDEGQAGPNPDEQAEGQARLNPGDTEVSQPLPSHVVHVGSDLEHMDLDVADVSTQPHLEQMDEGFNATAYPNVQENLKLTVEEHVILEEPASSLGTLSSLQHLTKDLIFGDLFFNDKPSEADNDKATAETKVESMVSKSIDEVVTDTVDWAMQAPLRNHFKDLPEADMKEILQQRMWETDSYKTHEDHMQLYEAMEKSMNHDHSEELLKYLAEAHKKKKKRRDSLKTPPESPPHQPPPPPLPAGPSGASGSSQVPSPPPPPPSINQEGQSKGSATPSSSKIVASAEYQAWTMTDTILRPPISLTPADLQMDDDMAPDAQAQLSDDEDIRNAHIPMVNLRQDWWKPLKEERPATSEPAWSISSSDVPIPKNNWASALADEESLNSNLKTWKALHLDWSKSFILIKPLPLGSPPGQVIIQSDFFFNKDLEHLRYGSKGSRPVLSISNMKAVYYPDVGLEKMVPIRCGLKRSASMILLLCMVFLTGGSKDNDSTLTDTHLKIDEALDYRVKEFKVNRLNLGLNTRFWTREDVERIKEFMFTIQKRLKTRRVFCNLESFVGRRVRDGDYRLLKHTE